LIGDAYSSKNMVYAVFLQLDYTYQLVVFCYMHNLLDR